LANIEEVSKYWQGNNVPQRWYSSKKQFSLEWFNEISRARYEIYYPYLEKAAEFQWHAYEKVLEVGTGLGTDLANYARNGALVYGVDLGMDQINFTKKNFEIQGLSFVELSQGNAEDLPFSDSMFDLVYSFGVLHHTPNTELAIDEVHRVLKEDGQAIVMLYARGWKHYVKRCFIHGILLGKYFKLRSWQAVYNKVSEVNGDSPKTGVYTKKQVQAMFAKFSNVEIEKKRMGEFFDYKPYRTMKFPRPVQNFANLISLESFFGENWVIKAYKLPQSPLRGSLRDVLFKHY
jgi:ubiquinone/menaquinone biosynthesis C-methylase UbiE